MPDHVMNYVECDAPPEQTLIQWRQSRATPRRRRFRLRVPALRLAFA